MSEKSIAILVGGSDLFLGMRGISKGTKIIKQNIEPLFDELIILNYNYFLDFGSSLKKIRSLFHNKNNYNQIVLYGYSKGGDVVLQLARLLEASVNIDLLITIDIANGPWSSKLNRHVPSNVRKNINVFQRTPNFPLRSYGLPAFSSHQIEIENIDMTNKIFQNKKISHTNIEKIMTEKVIGWMRDFKING